MAIEQISLTGPAQSPKEATQAKDNSAAEKAATPTAQPTATEANAQPAKPTDSATSGTTTSDVSAGQVVGGIGGSEPFIKINGYGQFSSREIKSFSLNVAGFYPTCNLTIATNSGQFLSTAFPKDGDLVNVFIRSMKNEFKPIRLDFLITTVSSMMSKDPEGDRMKLIISGIVQIPKLYAETCDIAKDMTSYEALFDIATKLKLGFASNTVKTDFKDKMNWICPYFTYKDWMHDVVEHAYSDDTSFYDIWIDQYLNLNFVNLNKNMSILDKFDSKDGEARSAVSSDQGPYDKLIHTKAKIMLSNERGIKTTNYYFNKFSIQNNAGTVNLTNGYIRHLFWYNKLDEKVWDWEIKPTITAESNKDKVVMLGRAGEEFWKDEVKYKYAGIQYSLPDHNVHAFWKHAKYQNHQNLEFISKITITLNLPNINHNIYRGQVIPITFMLTQQEDRIKLASKKVDKAEEAGISVDRFLSGNYTILEISYNWKPDREETNADATYGTWSQTVVVGRREWTVPDKHPLKESEKLKDVVDTTTKLATVNTPG